MSKSTILRGKIVAKEVTFTESLTNRILSYDSTTGEITDRPALSASGFVSSSLPSAQIIVGNGSGTATAVAMTGVIAINNTGVTSIVDGSIVNADVNAAAAIAYTKLALTGSIVNADVNAAAAIAYSKLNLTGSIVDADVNAAAAIARTKIASGAAYRIVVNGATGTLAESAITASRAIVSDANGLPTAATTTAVQIGYSSNLTGDIQTQLDTQIAGHTTAALLQSPTASENGFAITWNDGSQEWELTDPVVQGIPTGGASGTVLMKDSGTDFDASWTTLELANISDVTADINDVNLLTGAYAAGVTSSEITFLAGTTSAIQPQINLKLDKALTENYMFIGNASNVAIPFAPGPDTYQLTSVGGVPTWTAPSSGGTVTSVQVAGGTTGLTFSGGPVTTTGTITMAGALIADNGGTGQTSYTVGDFLYADTSSTLAKLADVATGSVLISGGVGVAPAWSGSTLSLSPTTFTLSAATIVNISGSNAQMIFTGASSQVRAQGYRGASTSTPLNIFASVDTNTVGVQISPSVGSFYHTSGDRKEFTIAGTYAPASGTGTFTTIALTNTINQGGGANGNFKNLEIIPTYTVAGGDVFGIDYNPTITSVAGTHYAFRATSGKVLIGGTSITAGANFEIVPAAVGAIANGYGLYVQATTGATANYSALFTGGDGIMVNGMRIWSDHDTTGNDNFLIGLTTPTLSGVTGSDNFTWLGLQSLTSGNRNIAIGNTSGQSITEGSHNILLGGASGGSIVSGNGNVIIGDYAGVLATGNNNIILGWTAGDALTTGSSNFIIGTEVDAQSATASNQLTIQNAIFGLSNAGTGTTVSSGVIGLYSTAAIGSWQKATFIGNVGVESTAIANGIVLYGKDSSDGATNSTLAMYLEQAPEASGTFTQTHRLKIWVNGVEYWLSLDAV